MDRQNFLIIDVKHGIANTGVDCDPDNILAWCVHTTFMHLSYFETLVLS
jgi:hypothetical protein